MDSLQDPSSLKQSKMDQEVVPGLAGSIEAEADHESSCSDKFNNGRWTKEECTLFCKLYQTIGKDWKALAKLIPSRTAQQVRSHAQKYLSRKLRKQTELQERTEAQRLIEEAPNQRSTRAKKISSTYFEHEEETIPSDKNIQQKKKKIEGQLTSLNKIDQDNTAKKALKKYEKSNIKNSNKSSYSREHEKFYDSLPCIVFPQSDTKETKYRTETSFLYQTLLPFIKSGRPFPQFIKEDNSLTFEQCKFDNKQTSLNEIKQIPSQNKVYSRGFIKLRGSDSNKENNDSIFKVSKESENLIKESKQVKVKEASREKNIIRNKSGSKSKNQIANNKFKTPEKATSKPKEHNSSKKTTKK